MSKDLTRFYDYVEINIETVQKIFSNYSSKIIVDEIKLISEGRSTTNYIVYTNNNIKKYLLKIYPVNDEKCGREYASYKYAKTKINVPDILYFDESEQIYHKPYMIIEYIESITLKEFIIKIKHFPESIAFDIGCNLGKLHQVNYDIKALFKRNLNLDKQLPPIYSNFASLLNNFAGKHINSNLKKELLYFIDHNKDILQELEKVYVFSHGDFNLSNILVDSNEKIWFIDFEYTLSSSIYLDIGKFFRYNDNLNMYRTKCVYDSFYEGYNKHAIYNLPKNWIKLAMIYDMVGMMSLINNEKVNQDWVKKIEIALNHTMLLL